MGTRSHLKLVNDNIFWSYIICSLLIKLSVFCWVHSEFMILTKMTSSSSSGNSRNLLVKPLKLAMPLVPLSWKVLLVYFPQCIVFARVLLVNIQAAVTTDLSGRWVLCLQALSPLFLLRVRVIHTLPSPCLIFWKDKHHTGLLNSKLLS